MVHSIQPIYMIIVGRLATDYTIPEEGVHN